MVGKIRFSYIIGGIAVLLFVGGYYGFLKKKKMKIINLQSQYDKLCADINKARAVARKRAMAERQFKIVTLQWNNALKMLPKSANIPDILSELTRVAGASGVKIVGFKPKRKKESGKYSELPIEIAVIGGYHSLARFFASVNNMERIINVKDLSLERDANTKKISAKFMAIAYFSKGGKVVKKKKK